MGRISKAIIWAVGIHGVYFVSAFVAGYIKTINYKPDFETAWTNVENLSSEVGFGYATSPFLYLGTFLGTVLVCIILLNIHDRLFSSSSKTET